jgi:hypothetical protein
MDRFRFFLCFVLLTGLLVACSSPLLPAMTATTTATAISTPTHQSSSSSPIVGTYTMTITPKDIASANNPRITFEVQPGGWNLVLRSDGYYTVTTNYHPYGMSYVGEGTYTIEANRMLMKDGNCWEYFGSKGRFGTYTWSFQGKRLVFAAVVDQCLSRKLVFTLHPWLLQT